eukprot:502107_1
MVEAIGVCITIQLVLDARVVDWRKCSFLGLILIFELHCIIMSSSQHHLLYILDDLLATLTVNKTLTCCNCPKSITVSTYPHDKYKINDTNKIKKFGFSITEGIHCRYAKQHLHRDTEGQNLDYYLSDDYDDNGIIFCNECVDGLYPCFICHKLDCGGPGTDPSDCDYCVNKVIEHVCRRDHLNVNIAQIQSQRANKDHYDTTFNPRLFVCKYCLKLKIGREFSHYIDYEYNENGRNNDDTVGAYDDDKENIYVHYSSNDEYESEPDQCGWIPPVALRSMCNVCAHRYCMDKKVRLTNAYIHQYFDQKLYVPKEIVMSITLYYYPPNKQHQFDDYLRRKREEEIAADLRYEQFKKEAVWTQKKAKHVITDDTSATEAIVCKTVLSDRFLMILINDEDFPMKEDFGDEDIEWKKYREVEKIYLKCNIKFLLSKYLVIQVYNGLFRLIQRNKIAKWRHKVVHKRNKSIRHEMYRDVFAQQLFDLIVKLSQIDIEMDDAYDINGIYDDVSEIAKRGSKLQKRHQNELYKLGSRNVEVSSEESKCTTDVNENRSNQLYSKERKTNDGDDESENESTSSVVPNLFSDNAFDSD